MINCNIINKKDVNNCNYKKQYQNMSNIKNKWKN